MLVTAWDIRRRSKRAIRGASGTSSSKVDLGMADSHQEQHLAHDRRRYPRLSAAGFGMRANDENSSTMRLMSSTWRTIVSVH